jgi:hypothetical protein
MKNHKDDKIINTYTQDGINTATNDLLFNDPGKFKSINDVNLENAIAFLTIDRFTRFKEEEIFAKALKLYYKTRYIDFSKITYNEVKEEFEYKDGDLILNFDMISNHINSEKFIEELTSKKRYEKCHIRSVVLGPIIKDSRVVTGYITIGREKSLHSIVEYECDGEIYALDWTRNLKMPKNQYIKLTDFVELSAIPSDTIVNDFEKIIGNLCMGIKPYLVFRDELMKDMDKNKELFQTTDTGKEFSENLNELYKDDSSIKR